MAFRFFEVAADRKTIVGEPLVAKEGKYVTDGTMSARNKQVEISCWTQHIAATFADEFNAKLNVTRRADEKTPRIHFLPCSVYKLEDEVLGPMAFLVEPRVNDADWVKWNGNNGYVEGVPEAARLGRENVARGAVGNLIDFDDLNAIAEDDEEEESNSEESVEGARRSFVRCFTASEVAQAFSHFTYWHSGRRRLVCDLQGALRHNCLQLSDPVIHYHNPGSRREGRRVHGKTDKGESGVGQFFETHRDFCGPLCRIMIRGFRPHRQRRQRSDPHSRYRVDS